MSKDWKETVRALLDKAAATEFAAEREVFEAKAMELIHKHGLNEDDINRVKRGQIEFIKTRVEHKHKQNYTPGKWADYISQAAAEFTSTFLANYSEGVQFYGPADRTKLAAELFQAWRAELLNRCTADTKVVNNFWHKDNNPQGVHRKVWRGDYMYAAGTELLTRVRNLKAKVLDNTTTAIVLVELEEIRNWVKNLDGLVDGRTSQKRKILTHAKRMGTQAARDLDIQSKLEGSND